MNDPVFIPLHSGGFAIVDSRDVKSVSGYRWTFMKGRGVASYQKREPGQSRQTILMHNLIAPYLRVSFRNGDKRDCRRANLKPFDWRNTATGKKSIKGNVVLLANKFCWRVRRSIIEQDKLFAWATTVCFKKIRNQNEAETIARNLAGELFTLSRQDFMEFVKWRQSRKPANEILSDWSAFDGAEFTSREVWESGITKHSVGT